MLKIGDFARLGQVSVVTLRHYVHVDYSNLLKSIALQGIAITQLHYCLA